MLETLTILTEWMAREHDTDAQLVIGLWSAGNQTWYATVTDLKGNVIAGESSYGSRNVEEALEYCWREIAA